MTTRKKLFALLAWLQLVISVSMGILVIWAYLSYRAPVGQFMQSIETTMFAGSSLLEGTRGTIEARSNYLDESLRLLLVLKMSLLEVSGAVKNQQKMGPQYTESMRSASSIAGTMSEVLHDTGNDLMNLQVPNGIKIKKGKPDIKYHYPFKNLAAKLEQNSQEFKKIGKNISNVTDTISRDSQNLGDTTIALTGQAIKVVDETFRRLLILKEELPKALDDLKSVSDSLKKLSAQVHYFSYIGIVLLTFGLLMSAWCFVHSIGALMVIRSQAFEMSAIKNIAAVDLSK